MRISLTVTFFYDDRRPETRTYKSLATANDRAHTRKQDPHLVAIAWQTKNEFCLRCDAPLDAQLLR